MKVKFKVSTVGAGGKIRPGDVVEVSDGEAKILIDAKLATEVKPRVPTQKGKQKKG